CKARFSRRYNLTTHVKTHDKQRIKEHGCTFCDKAFDRKHDRDRHVATVHHNKRTFTCKICPTSFTRRDALSRH
ncbi:C2H2-type zinc finger transcription factor, partial [Phycomyces blakesleeanus NRRL 1555(-)]